MSWVGKIIGGGLGLILGGGPLGMVLGAALGHMAVDRKSGARVRIRSFSSLSDVESMQSAYFVLLFSLLAKIARADGSISQGEGRYLLGFLDELGLDNQQRQLAINIFNNAKNQSDNASDYATQFYDLQRNEPAILQAFFEQLVQMAMVDGCNNNKKLLLEEVAQAFHLDPRNLARIFLHYNLYSSRQGSTSGHWPFAQQHTQPDPYQVLGAERNASIEELKHCYRKLARETHPDTLVARGIPPEFRPDAEKRFKELQNAWEQIRSERNIG